MSKIITTDSGKQYQDVSKKKTVGAILAGSSVNSCIAAASMGVALPFKNKMKNIAKSADSVQLTDAVVKTFGGGALQAKGVQFVNVNEKTPYTSMFDSLPKFLKHKLDPVYGVLAGENAFYIPSNKQIIVNLEKFGLSAFHEMGHAFNHNCSKFWNVMQKMRKPMMSLSGLFALTALLKRKKVDGEKPKNTFDKVTTFIKNNVGKLVTLSFVPIVAEEIKGSLRGNKMAAKVLSPDMLKKVKMSNRLGAITYIVSGVATGVGAYLASKVRDKIAQPKEV